MNLFNIFYNNVESEFFLLTTEKFLQNLQLRIGCWITCISQINNATALPYLLLKAVREASMCRDVVTSKRWIRGGVKPKR